MTADWESRVDAVWDEVADLEPDELVRRIDALAGERDASNAAALFERACARDTAGLEAEAEGFYRAALATGELDPVRYSRAVLQFGSTLRNVGRLDESRELLESALERSRQEPDTYRLADETRAILALTYVALGRGAEATAHVLMALAPHLSRYQRSMKAYAEDILADAGTPEDAED
jgi:tetratricopeptide (TPR) repeat protein